MSFNNSWDCYLSYNSISSTLINDFSKWNTMIPPNFKALEDQKGRTEPQKTGRNTKQRMAELQWARSRAAVVSIWNSFSSTGETIRLETDTVEHRRRRPWAALGSNWWPEWRNLSLRKRNAHQRCPKKHQNPKKKKSLGHLVSLTMDFFSFFFSFWDI